MYITNPKQITKNLHCIIKLYALTQLFLLLAFPTRSVVKTWYFHALVFFNSKDVKTFHCQGQNPDAVGGGLNDEDFHKTRTVRLSQKEMFDKSTRKKSQTSGM